VNASNRSGYVPRGHVIVGSVCLALKTRDSCFKDNLWLLRKRAKMISRLGSNGGSSETWGGKVPNWCVICLPFFLRYSHVHWLILSC